RLDRWKFREGVIALLPVLSEHGVQTLLSLDLSKRDLVWPLEEVARRLIGLGHADEAAAWLTGQRAAKRNLYACQNIVAELPADAQRTLRTHLESLPLGD